MNISIYRNTWQYRSSNAPSRNLVLKNTLCTWTPFLLCGLMCHQETWSWEGLVTLYALKWLLSRVGPLMFLQVTSYLEALFNFEHLKGFSFMWVLSKFYKWSDFKRLLSHFEHLKSFSPVWVLSAPWGMAQSEERSLLTMKSRVRIPTELRR